MLSGITDQSTLVRGLSSSEAGPQSRNEFWPSQRSAEPPCNLNGNKFGTTDRGFLADG